MNQPTDLAAVRAAAELIRSWLHVEKSPQDHPWWALDMRDLVKAESQAEMILVDYILATIPADATLPITAEWLREVGFTEVHNSEEPDYIIIDEYGTLRMKVYQVGSDVFTCEEPDWPDDLHCRIQVHHIMTALGIQPQPPKAKE